MKPKNVRHFIKYTLSTIFTRYIFFLNDYYMLQSDKRIFEITADFCWFVYFTSTQKSYLVNSGQKYLQKGNFIWDWTKFYFIFAVTKKVWAATSQSMFSFSFIKKKYISRGYNFFFCVNVIENKSVFFFNPAKTKRKTKNFKALYLRRIISSSRFFIVHQQCSYTIKHVSAFKIRYIKLLWTTTDLVHWEYDFTIWK